MDDKKQPYSAATAVPVRGGKRKKDEDDEGDREFEEGGKRIKQESTSNPRDDPSFGANSSALVSKDSSGIAGAKRKAASLSGDEEEEDVNRQLEHGSSATTEMDPEIVETEYAGSPRRDDANGSENADADADGDENGSVSASQAPTEPADYDPADSVYFPSSQTQHDYSTESQEQQLPETQLDDDMPMGDEEESGTPKASQHDYEDSDERVPPHLFSSNSFSSSNPAASSETKPAIPEAPAADSISASQLEPTPSQTALVYHRTPSGNRVSISYAGSSRRLVLDAEIVEQVKIFRAEGRIVVKFSLQKDTPPKPAQILPAKPQRSPVPDVVASSTSATLVDNGASAPDSTPKKEDDSKGQGSSSDTLIKQEGSASVEQDVKEPSSLDDARAPVSASAAPGVNDSNPLVKHESDESLLPPICRGILASSFFYSLCRFCRPGGAITTARDSISNLFSVFAFFLSLVSSSLIASHRIWALDLYAATPAYLSRHDAIHVASVSALASYSVRVPFLFDFSANVIDRAPSRGRLERICSCSASLPGR